MTGCGAARNGTEDTASRRGSEASAVHISGSVCQEAAAGSSGSVAISREEVFREYEPFGLTYDAAKDQLVYDGKPVRWFEDYYDVGNGNQAGVDFFNEKGLVDVYAVRDDSDPAKNDDGSFDPKGSLQGIEPFSQEEFDHRDLEAIRHPKQISMSGEPLTPSEARKIAEEYEPFGVTYDVKNDRWYYDGEKVRYFHDILTSNGEDPSSGKFHGAMRLVGDEEGTVDIYTVRDYTTVNAEGYGTLKGVERYTQEEFDSHTDADFIQNID